MPIGTIALVVSALIFGPLSSYLAGRRARSPITWFALGVVIGPFAVALLVLAPPGRCPECAARVHGWPQRCDTCGAALSGAVDVQGDAAAGPPPAERPLVVRPVGGSTTVGSTAAPSGMVSGSSAGSDPNARPVLTVVSPPAQPATSAGPAFRPPRDRSWEAASPSAAAAMSAERAQARARGKRPVDLVADDARILGSAIFLGGSAPTSTKVSRLEVGERYGLARDGDELQVLGPVTLDPERIVARVPIEGGDVTMTSGRLVVKGGPAGRGTVLTFTGLSVQRGTDVVAILSTPSEEAQA